MNKCLINKIRHKASKLLNFDLYVKEIVYTKSLEELSLRSMEPLVEHSSNNILVSLTTYSKRIYDVHLVVESLGRQTVKPNRIILWLDQDEFDADSIPIILKLQKKRGLEVRFCNNIKSYKKLIPSLNEFPGYDIITVDDDIIYPIDLVEKFVLESKLNPNTIIANLVHKITMDNSGRIKSYTDWNHYTTSDEASMLILPVGAGGVYYPNDCFHKDIVNQNLFMNLSPSADDLWFKVMTVKNGFKSKRVSDLRPFSDRFINISHSQEMGLHHQNVTDGLNDMQFNSILKYYDFPYSYFNC